MLEGYCMYEYVQHKKTLVCSQYSQSIRATERKMPNAPRLKVPVAL